MDRLNYHHLRYFREVARAGGALGRTAEALNVSQSALSIQIKQLEARLGHPLFDRVGRRLELTEAGRLALDYADRIFSTGEELLDTLERSGAERPPLRVGALSTLSRNFQLGFLRPLLQDGRWPVALQSGNMRNLLALLEALSLDVILTTQVPEHDAIEGLAAQRIDTQIVQAHGVAERLGYETLVEMLEHEPLILPTDAIIRSGFESLIARLGVRPRVVADVDDMAMVRLLAREGAGIAIAPAVVLSDEIKSGLIATAPFDLGLIETFYAITISRQFPHPALPDLLQAQTKA